MGKKDILKTKSILFELFKNKNISIDKIIIFGSYARGKEQSDSDIDVMVISRDFRGKDIFQKVAMARGVHSGLVSRIKRPVDLLYYSDKEWDKGSSIIINTAKNEGLIFHS